MGKEEIGVPDYMIEASRMVMEEKMPRFKKAVRKGVPIAFGTDAGSPLNYHDKLEAECKCMVDGGMTPMDVICSMTRNAARLLQLEDRLGTLEPDKKADIVILGGNPLDDIGQVENVATVFKDGIPV